MIISAPQQWLRIRSKAISDSRPSLRKCPQQTRWKCPAQLCQSQSKPRFGGFTVLVCVYILVSDPDPELFPGSGIFSFRSSKNENENKLQFIYIFWPVNSQILDAGTKMDRIRIAGSGINHSGFITLMVCSNTVYVLPV